MDDEVLSTLPYDGSAQPSGSEGPQLLALEGPLRARVFPLDGAEMSLGRSPQNGLVLPSAAVSGRHALIRCEQGLYFIEDLGSTNGLRVNGSLLEPGTPRRLDHGDNFTIAENLFLFRQEVALADAGGLCSIQLDQGKIDSEVEQLLADWKQATERP